MDLSTNDSEFVRPDSTTDFHLEDPSVELGEPDRSSVEILVPHLVAATLMLATVTITPPIFWNTMALIVSVTLGPTLFTLSVVAGLCGLVSYALIWLFCERSSRAYYRSISKSARRAAARRKRAA